MTLVSFHRLFRSKPSTLPIWVTLIVIMFKLHPFAACLLTQAVVRYGSIHAINIGESCFKFPHVDTEAQ